MTHLAGLDSIDWVSLGAADVPKWLYELASPDFAVRTKAYNQLEQKIAYQGSTSWENYGPPSELLNNEFPLLVTPFLIELVSSDNIKNKDGLLELLQDLATYQELASEEPYKTRSTEVFNAVRKGVQVYQSLLKHESPVVKMCAAQLLEVLGEAIN